MDKLTTPVGLRRQLLAVITAVTLVSGLGLNLVSNQRLAASVRESTAHWAEALARAAAEESQASMEAGDLALTQERLRDLARLPGVLRLDVAGPDGQPLTSLQAAPDGRVLIEDGQGMRLPASGDPAVREVAAGEHAALQAWTGVGVGARHGSIGVTLSTAGETRRLDRLRVESLLGLALLTALTLGAIWIFVGSRMAGLQRVVEFSRRLGTGAGAVIDHQPVSREEAELGQALNEASLRLHAQMETIRLSEERTSAILNAVPDAIIGFDVTGRITIASPAVSGLFGRSLDELIGQPLEPLLPGLSPADAERRTLEGAFMRSSGRHVARFETLASRTDGTPFPVEVSLSRVEGQEGPRYACVVRDLTESRMSQDMLNLYSRALDCTSNGVLITDMTLPMRPIFYANPAFYRITGYEPGEVIGMSSGILLRDDLAQPELAELEAAVQGRRAATAVLRNYRKDGTLFFNEFALAPVISAEGEARHYVGIVNDVTERERSRLAAAERSARLNAIFDLSPDGFVVFDRAGELVYTNQAFLGMTGWDEQVPVQGLTLADFDERLRSLRDPSHAFPPLSLEGGADGGFETMDLLQLALPRPRVLTRLVRHNAGGQGESILYFRDVTHETEVDRMKSEFLTTAAHELRTPMVSVFGFTELLLNRPLSESKRRDVLETIHRQSSLLINMVNELLDLARIEARQVNELHCERATLGGLIETAVRSMDGQDASRETTLRIAQPDAELMVDAEKFHRALGNVISNAYKYSPQGGEVVLETLEGQLGGRPAVGVRVSDRGIGMTATEVGRVFERFYRADPSGNIPGTGLGMSLVKEIVELHGGEVEVESTPGAGTAVTLWWPLCELQQPA